MLSNPETERERIAFELYNTGLQPVTWHSLTCVCDSCLNADALCFVLTYSGDSEAVNTAGLTRSKTSRV